MFYPFAPARNVLLDKQLICKVADFGMAKSVYGLSEYKGDPADKVPVRWCAPEVLRNSTFSFKSDVWSYGVLMYEIATHGGRLYSGKTNSEVLKGVLDGLRLPRPMDCNESLYSLMRSCWAANPEARASFKHLLGQLTTDVALSNTMYKPAGLLEDAKVIIGASSELTYIQIKKVLIERYGKTEFDSEKTKIQMMLKKASNDQ